MPGNMKLNPKDVFELFLQNSLKNPNQLLKGTRINRPFLDSFKTLIFGLIATLYFRINLLDAGGTPNLVHRSFLILKVKCLQMFLLMFLPITILENWEKL